MGKEDGHNFGDASFKDLMDLDTAYSRAVQKGKNGLSETLRKLSISETDHPDWYTTQVPDYFDEADVRKPPGQVVDDIMHRLIVEAFDVRFKMEKKMSRKELLAFDKVLAKQL